MDRYSAHDGATSNVLAWTSQCANVEPSADEDAGADADEPPERQTLSTAANHFKRAPIRQGTEPKESLLTRALHSQSEEDALEHKPAPKPIRRRSITSNFSLASTGELTCDTAITTPARTCSPSPRQSAIGFNIVKKSTPMAIASQLASTSESLPGSGQLEKDPAVQALEKKRCISFACVAKPKPDDRAAMPPPPPPRVEPVQPSGQQPSKPTTIKFSCLYKPSRDQEMGRPSVTDTPVESTRLSAWKNKTSEAVPKYRAPSATRSGRSLTPRPTLPVSYETPLEGQPRKLIRAEEGDFESESSRFHEFASDELRDDDWILKDESSFKRKLTVNDTLAKENAIRKIGKEAEEEADLEEEMANGEENDENEDDGGDGDDETAEPVDEDDYSGCGSDLDTSDGYHSDNEIGFAESEDEDDGLELWSLGGNPQLHHDAGSLIRRGPSKYEDQSDSSVCGKVQVPSKPRSRSKRTKQRAPSPELPDSTDFVCGTLDEDQPLQEAYISRIAARKLEKFRPIPQDIDPSFPTSEPEDEPEERYHSKGDSGEQIFHVELEEHDRAGRRKTSGHQSPKRYRSPPPKNLHSPPKVRGRSPRRVSDRHSPKRMKSPGPLRAREALFPCPMSLADRTVFKNPALQLGLNYTHSLPRPPFMLPHLKGRRSRANTSTKDSNHVRGAIDIIQGLEQKRQRRKEKFNQKYCSRARRDKGPEKRPPPGQGAERMREIGLLMAGKINQGNYVLSV